MAQTTPRDSLERSFAPSRTARGTFDELPVLPTPPQRVKTTTTYLWRWTRRQIRSPRFRKSKTVNFKGLDLWSRLKSRVSHAGPFVMIRAACVFFSPAAYTGAVFLDRRIIILNVSVRSGMASCVGASALLRLVIKGITLPAQRCAFEISSPMELMAFPLRSNRMIIKL